jgi:ER membrane protein SH3
VSAFVTAGAGFLLAVLWFDLMFDVQVLGHGERDLPEDVLASIAGYYRRVTTSARPMNRLIAAVMLATIAAILVQLAQDEEPGWVAWSSIALAAMPILLAGLRTVPSAVRLGARSDAVDLQSELARSICREHLLCFVAIAAVLAIQLSFA